MKIEEVAKLLSEMFGGLAPCDFLDIIEWLPRHCEGHEEYQCSKCGLKCWMLFLEHRENYAPIGQEDNWA